MKKTLISTTLLTLLATTGLSTGMVGAATVDTKPSDAAVLFTEKSNPLEITAVPDMHFGSHEIDRSKRNDYPVIASGTHVGKGTLTTANTVSIQDDRSKAKLDGWDLQVQQTNFTNMGDSTGVGADPTDTLNGTQVVFKTGTSTIDQTNPSGVASFGADEIALNTAPATFMRGDATAYGSVKATLGTGIGADAINLRVPSTVNPTEAVHYQSELTWSLVAGPTAS
ncbi:WxL domain-containing protein [Latilactobacillus graminis]|uniref:WxL domain-containing protein n=2 Tax=Latilactobacillus graminis TaxID=60519 RepID=A0AA89I3C3_9LACO|nr:WxL domain-containing protein [Latilactobacillus graminis]KRM23918.1 hypothetical protein FC90_GL001157 [Latilactobacillus graminis DSM 20719]QFP79915.1 hypothetical protein LG542_06480 [Latilactobacillus graminis]